MEDRTVLRFALIASFAIMPELAFEIGNYWTTPIGGVPVLLLGVTGLLFVNITHEFSSDLLT